jgi:galactonate dehydratase
MYALFCPQLSNFLEWQSYFHTDPFLRKLLLMMVNGLKIVLLQFQTKPGIGVEINEEGMKKYAIPNVPFFA